VCVCVCGGGGPRVLVCYAIFVPNSFVTYHSLSPVLTTLSLSIESLSIERECVGALTVQRGERAEFQTLYRYLYRSCVT
jgi:hypothetical protein